MKLISLVENSSCHPACGSIHGLSLYLETEGLRVLFDMGPNALFLENANILGVDIAQVDVAILSHGHYDHGGGLGLFCKRNETAKVYIAPGAFAPHGVAKAVGYEDIGLPKAFESRWGHRFSVQGGEIGEGLFLLRDIPGTRLLSGACASLLEAGAQGYAPDPFLHEQSLLVRREGKSLLLAGCAHRGIVNILEAAEAVNGGEFDWVISGFHLTNPGLGVDEPTALITAVGEALQARKTTRYITGHCTGSTPYAKLKDVLGERLADMPAGRILTL